MLKLFILLFGILLVIAGLHGKVGSMIAAVINTQALQQTGQ